VEDKINAIDRLDFRKTNIAADATTDADRQYMQRSYVMKELSDLKLLVDMEVGFFSSDNLMVVSSIDETLINDETKQQLLEDYLAYDKNKPLQPIKVKLSDESLALINFKDNTTITGKADTYSSANTKDDGSLTAQVLKLLESNNAKLDGMQKQIDDLRTEQLRLWQQQQDEKSLAMQKQIDDLREMVFALVQMNTGDAIADGGKGTVAPERFKAVTVSNVPSSMNVYFAKAMTTLDAGSKLALNEIVDILARDPSLNLIITGYADKTGDAAKNLIISQERANNVKRFLISSGLSSDRFITKYFGDRDSSNESTNDRKVLIEFVR
jgi:outer membrane protein OmpA-like peptidoglycan-associated protein